MSPASRRARPAALVFDLDGTLVDSRRDIATAVNRLRGELGLAALPLEAILGMVGEGARLLVERALAADRGAALEPDLDGALARYLEIYREVCLDTTVPYPGIPALLADLSRRYPLALLSNKGEALSRVLLDGLGLTPWLPEVLGGDSLATRKPDPAGLALLARRLAVPVADLALVGDSRVDAETARNAGSSFALAEWGFPPATALAGVKADWRFASPKEMREAFLG